MKWKRNKSIMYMTIKIVLLLVLLEFVRVCVCRVLFVYPTIGILRLVFCIILLHLLLKR